MWKVKLSFDTERSLQDLKKGSRDKIIECIDMIEKNPFDDSLDIKKIDGFENDYRLIVGKQQLFFIIFNQAKDVLFYRIVSERKTSREK